MDPDFPDHLRGPWAKLENYAPRFGLVLQELQVACGEATSEDVDEESVLGAAATTDYFKSHARRVYKCLRVSPEGKRAEAAERWIRRRGDQCTSRDLSRAGVPGIDTTKAATGVLQYLVDRERGRWEPRRQGNPVFLLGEATTS